jgi:hypothetical protein
VLLKKNDIDGANKAPEECETKCVVPYDLRVTNLVFDAYCREGLVDGNIKKGKKPYANTWYKLVGTVDTSRITNKC